MPESHPADMRTRDLWLRVTNLNPPRLLVVDADEATRTFLADNLCADGYEPRVAPTARDAVRTLEYHRIDLVLLGLGLPDGAGGLEVLAHVRAADGPAGRVDARVPVIVLSGRAEEIDRVRAFERGADDFVSKPFSYAELRLRIGAVLRRAGERRAGGRLRVGALEIDPASREVRVGGARVTLSQKEFALVQALAAEPTRVFTKAELLRDVWGFRATGATRTLDSHACRLRQKLGARGDRFVVNVWGVGYRLVDGAVPEAAAAATDRELVAAGRA
jgi:DNA-binding response OmpR family regulator